MKPSEPSYRGSFFERHPIISLLTFPFSLIILKWGEIFRKNAEYEDLEAEVKRRRNDMSGIEYEQYVAKRLKIEGFRRISMTPESGDFGADIIAYDDANCKTCIQCKRYSRPIGVKSVQEVYAAKEYYECDRALVITNSTFTKAAVELAENVGVELVEEYI